MPLLSVMACGNKIKMVNTNTIPFEQLETNKFSKHGNIVSVNANLVWYDSIFDTKPLPVRNFTQVGTQNNLWDNEQSGTNGLSNIVDSENYPFISILGEAESGTTINVYVSQDGTNFTLCSDLSSRVNNQTGNSFHIYFQAGVRYFQLESESDVIISATLAGKP